MKSSSARSRAVSSFTMKLLCGTALAGGALLAVNPALAQNENVTVTGTSIRGVQPVGASTIQVDRQQIEETAAVTTSELLTNIPQITGAAGGFGSSGQRNEGGGGAIASPNIHSLGTQASTATLILIDGHIFAPVGQTTNVVDPSIIPSIALQGVDVLPDGASAIYGANAVAGVINFITRKDYDGWETRVQAGMADHYNSFTASQLWGHSWDNGGVLAAYTYSSRSSLDSKWRKFETSRQDIRMGKMTAAQAAYYGFPSGYENTVAPANFPLVPLVSDPIAVEGSDAYRGMAIPYPSIGNNFQNFNCPVAAISTTSSGNAFLYPYTLGGINNITVVGPGTFPTTTQSGYRRTVTGAGGQGVCDQDDYSSDLVSSTQNNMIISIRQAITDNINFSVDLVRGVHMTGQRNARGTLNATAFSNTAGTGGPAFGGGQRNPFYVPVPNATGNSSEFISFSFDQLLGPGAFQKNNTTNQFAAFTLDADLGGGWAFTLLSTLGSSSTASVSNGSVNAAQASLALNGTTNTSGTGGNALADPYLLGNVTTVTRVLTSANALDVWQPAATNRTSDSVKRSLVDNYSNTVVYNNVQDVNLKVDGPLPLDLGSGPIKSAFGVDYFHITQPQYQASPNGIGPSSTSSRGRTFAFARRSYSAYAEFLIPLINPDYEIPLVQSFTLDVSGRYDSFNDFGDTKNHKLSAAWGVIDGFSLRGTFSSSFVAPNVHDVGGPAGVNSQTNVNTGQIASNRRIPFLSVNPLPYSQGPFTARGVGTAGTIVESQASCLALNGVTGLSTGTATLVDIEGTPTPTQTATTPMGTGIGQAYACQILTQGNNGFTGLVVGGANADLKPERGLTYSAGIDLDGGQLWDVLEGLTAEITYYNTKFLDVVTNQQVEQNIPESTSFGPAVSGSNPLGGWSNTDPVILDLVATRPVSNTLPSRIYTIRDNRIQNPFTIWQAGFDFSINYRVQTDSYGTFTLGLNGNQIVRFSQKPNSSIGVLLDVMDCKNNARYCSSELAGSVRLGWRMDAYSAGLTFNYMHPFQAALGTFPFNNVPQFNGSTYGHIGSLQTIDLNLGYQLPEEWSSGTSVQMTINNLLDKAPPFWNNANGFTVGSQIGRTVNVSLTKKW